MEEYLKLGKSLFHKYLGNVSVVQMGKDRIKVDTYSHGILDFEFYNFGKVLFFEKAHAHKSFESYFKYIEFCEEEKRIRIEEEAREKEEYQNEAIRKELEVAERKVKIEVDYKNKLIQHLKDSYKYDGFYHYTDISNFINIMKTGNLYSRNKAAALGFTDAADHLVLSHTNKYIMDYVRFFYKEKTPTLYRNEGIKSDNMRPHMPIPVLLIFNENIIQNPGVAFLSGGGGNPNSVFTKDISEAKNFDWKVIFYRGPIPRYENDLISVGNDSSGASITNKKNAEFLYPDEIDIKYIKRIIFRAPADMKTAECLLGKNELFELDYSSSKFNYTQNFLYDCEIRLIDSGYLIALMLYNPEYKNYIHKLKIFYSDNGIEELNIELINDTRRIDIKKPTGYGNYAYYFVFRPLPNKKVIRIEYYMNGHLSAANKEG